MENIQHIFVIDNEAALKGAVPIGRIVLAAANTPLMDLSVDPLISARAQESARSVVDLFNKYNLMSLPVVDDDRHLLGFVSADDVLEVVINRK